MSTPILTEPGYTKFNLTYPQSPFNSTGAAPNEGTIEDSPTTPPAILLGILLPHTITTLIILARISSRLFLLRKWFLDDTLILLSWIFSTSVCIVYIIASQSPSILLSSTTTRTTLESYILRTYIGLITYQLSLLLTKLSILSFYHRIFSAASSLNNCSTRPQFILQKRLSQATIIFVTLYGVPLLFMSVFQCHPSPGQFFNLPMRCFTFIPLLITSASLHTATDAWLILLIIPVIIRLDLPRRQKFALGAVLSLGVFVIAASLTRLQLSLRAGYAPSGSPGEDGDGDGEKDVKNTLAFFVMTVLELDVALICACAPTLRPIIARFWPRLGMGEREMADVRGSRRRSRWRQSRRWLVAPRRWRATGEGETGSRTRSTSRESSTSSGSGSVDLTSVSYHGYPWTRPVTPAAAAAARSKNPSLNNLGQQTMYYGSQKQGEGQGEDLPTMPMPPVARISTYRTPTTLSLRSFISSIAAPRSRGGVLSGGADSGGGVGDKAGLLPNDCEVIERRRRSSVGFEGYFDQYLGYGDMSGNGETGGRRTRRNSRNIRVETSNTTRNSLVGGGSGGRWMDSQESFVLGVNDPNSPAVSPTVNRLSPVLSDSGTLVASGTGSDSGQQTRGSEEEKEKERAPGVAVTEKPGERDLEAARDAPR